MLTLTQPGTPQPPAVGQLAAGPVQSHAGGAGANPQPGGGNGGAHQGGYLAMFHTGQLPAARGTVATALAAKGPPATQRTNAEALYQFLSGGQNVLRDLNGDDTMFTAVVSILTSYKVKVI